MSNLEKMNELVGSNVDKEQIVSWAYMNRVMLCVLPDEEEFEEMKLSVENFMSDKFYIDNEEDEHRLWREFLDREFIS